MAKLEGWAIALIVIASVVAAVLALVYILNVWARRAYKHLLNSPKTECDIDAFVGADNPVKALKVVALHKFQLGNRQASLAPIPLECVESPHVPGLRVSRLLSSSETPDKEEEVVALDKLLSDSSKTPIVIATIRMGFGHHRLAYSAASWALKTSGHPVIFHDLLNVKSPEADLIKSTDELYSRFSRYASEIGGPVEKLWGSLLLGGDADALRVAALTAAHLQPLLLSYPKDIPIIATHQLVALTAAAAGFTNVVNLVVDNHPQWFLCVPKTLNIVQGPVNYQSFLKMGIVPKEVRWAGHWCPAGLVENVEPDCRRRIARRTGTEEKPVRLLIPVGGAGAQRKFIIQLVRTLAGLVKNGKVQLFLNAGDHKHMKTAFLEVLDECSLDFDTIKTTAGVRAFQERLLEARNEPTKAVTLFAFDEYFPAVATTDILSRVADVLSCKPSELAFYCLPKLHIRRVGDHEADSAKRSSELGDGTIEARTIEDAMDFVNLFLASPDLLVSMNESIINNKKIGLYDGCKNAVSLVLDGAKKVIEA